jgi:dihydroorotase
MSETEIIRLPGLIDPHVHFREPGTNLSETIESGSRAALIGGYALVADMPNNPGHPTWTEERVNEKLSIAERDSHTLFAINAGSQPESDNIGQIESMMKTAISLKVYGGPTTGIDRKTDYEGSEFDEIIIELHRVAPDKPLLVHAGKHNLHHFIYEAAQKLNHPVHVCHVNDPEQVHLVTAARQRDLKVTCGVCPHHLLKTSHDRTTQGEFAKMQPPLADQIDAERLMHLYANGYIQIIETDHAPHSKEAKMKAEETGGDCYGVPGIEHAVALMLYQMKKGRVSMKRLIDSMSTQPAKVFGLKLNHHTYSNWELVDGRIENEDNIISGAGWTPYLGMNTYGRLVMSRINGQVAYMDSGETGTAVINKYDGKRVKTRGDYV